MSFTSVNEIPNMLYKDIYTSVRKISFIGPYLDDVKERLDYPCALVCQMKPKRKMKHGQIDGKFRSKTEIYLPDRYVYKLLYKFL